MHVKQMLASILLFVPTLSGAQTNEQLGSSYLAYPTPPALTPAPQGYEAIYLSHYGRHGSRWLTEDSRYEAVLKEFEGHGLTPTGKDVYQRLQKVWKDAKGRSGELTSIGEEQHHDIALRMTQNFPMLFQESQYITAQSSTSRRCMMSMMAACEAIKEQYPKQRIRRSAYERDMKVINQESDELKAFKKGELWTHTEDSIYEAYCLYKPLMKKLFLHPDKLENPIDLFDGLYWIASNMQDVTQGSLSFYDIMTREALESYWKAVNYRMYVTNGPASLSKGATERSSVNLLNDIIERAEEGLHGTSQSKVHLRYGHDSALLRLLTLMQVEECKQSPGNDTDADQVSKYWHDYELVPMAANLQLVFYRGKKKGDILVRLILNEKDAHLPLKATKGCFYCWNDVKEHWMKQINKQ